MNSQGHCSTSNIRPNISTFLFFSFFFVVVLSRKQHNNEIQTPTEITDRYTELTNSATVCRESIGNGQQFQLDGNKPAMLVVRMLSRKGFEVTEILK